MFSSEPLITVEDMYMAETWVSRPELEDVIGHDAADMLCRSYGGVPVYVPRRADPACQLGRILGVFALSALVAEYGGLRITVPNGRRGEPYKAAIARKLEKGQPHEQIALELGVTERYVRLVARSHKSGPRQLSFF